MHSRLNRPFDTALTRSWSFALIVGLVAWIQVGFGFDAVRAGDWLTYPSTYSHDPVTGSRVGQYQPDPTPTTIASAPRRVGGFNHFRSSLQYGPSADHYHRVESFGDPVQPYGEWRFPFRPFATPYPNWGPPLAGFGPQIDVNLQSVNGPLQNRGPIAGSGPLSIGGYRPGLPRGGFIGRPAVPGQPAYGASPLRYDPGYNEAGGAFRRGFLPGFRNPEATAENPYPLVPGQSTGVPPYFDGNYPVYRD